ncbi:thymidylate synthase [Pseudomonas phage Phabio]|uniref:thymidylate synthase n=1 Tax=Pseudomonas phage Phabio TaxID=2006668 RepID=A0A1Y0SU11_9CAUD|nr:thymidylate synthase [Pseudomonas phage Phabio]ARV76982.1 thymidylate synthase [Pseudomonas phage Phabio]
MQQYHEILEQIASQGSRKGDRTGTGTTSWFGQHKRFDLHHKFQPRLPVVTTKKIHLQSIEHELFWMLAGDTRLEYLIENGVRIWNEWVKPGTEVYRDLTFDELHTYLDKHWAVTATFTNSDTPYSMTWPDEGEKYLQISLDAYREATTTSDIELLGSGRGGDLNYEHLRRIYRVVEGKEPRLLVGGDLGPVYGKTWRDIDDVRIIPKVEWADYWKRQFDLVVDIPGEDYTKDRCVIQRKVDQVAEVLHLLEKEPDSRRIIICAWDPRLVEDQALPPCHAFIQFWTRELTAEERLEKYTAMEDQRIKDQIEAGIMERGQGVPSSVDSFIACMDLFGNKRNTIDDYHDRMDKEGVPRRAISCQLYQRSADTFLGVPFNITFYSLLTHMLANQFNMVAEEFIWTGGDTHVYSNHEKQVELQLTRECYGTPTITFKPESKGKHILDITRDDYTIDNYNFHPHIAGKVAV